MTTAAARPDLLQLLADLRGDAAVLRKNGQGTLADRYVEIADSVADAAHEFTTWLSEADAATRSGWSHETVRRWARKFVETPHVRWTKGKGYELLACIVPRRFHHQLAAADGASDVAA